MRYFLSLAYRGTRYAGWQRQPNALSVQEVLENSLSMLLRQPIEVVGCGRTDAGVHARYYVAHFDAEGELPKTFLQNINGILPGDIAVYTVKRMPSEAHARYDAVERHYCYYISLRKDPFAQETAWLYPHAGLLDINLLQRMANLLMQYEAFLPFCKTDSNVEHYRCRLHMARWEYLLDENQLVFQIAANRFLRGMVRLIVGTCLAVARGVLTLEGVREALEKQQPLPKSISVPAHGLALTNVRYPYPIS
ncbi:MAG: tRNA pseudouridine(38-40) synthase TruA [Saprospiraceae bacterium]|nr:tRNA pseudouridine(38-40) synthase TruA [Saprospiraceae bacterium]MDW8484834.1 tRNA pseudouridine synthase A [Saprospiraceae bacterium]